MSQMPGGPELNHLHNRLGRIADSEIIQRPVRTIAKGVLLGIVLVWLLGVTVAVTLSMFGFVLGGLLR